MAEAARKLSCTFAEYLAVDEAGALKHEYLNGEIFAMSGGTPEHSQIAASVIRELGSQLRGRPCVVYTSDLRVRVLATGLATYPDVTVICGPLERDPANKNTATNPVVIVEVLSDSTEDYDREEKLSHYRRIPSLREYLLVSQHERRIEHLSRNDDGTWTLRDVAAPATGVQLPSIGCALSLDEVYRDLLMPRRLAGA
jgi:Uma2 family endonuclease